MIYKLIKIYSVIIRYSQLFNTVKYRNKFMGRFFRLITLNYLFFVNLANYCNSSDEIKNKLLHGLVSIFHM